MKMHQGSVLRSIVDVFALGLVCAALLAGPNPAEARFKRRAREGYLVERRAPAAPSTPQPEVVDYAPKSGPAGTVVTVSGRQLDGVAKVLLNGQQLPLLSLAPRVLTVRIPAGASSGALLIIARDGRTIVVGASFQVPAPTAPPPVVAPPVVAPPAEEAVVIAAFNPDRGRVGDLVTLEGRGFLASDRVWIGAAECPVRAIAASRIVVQVPVTTSSATFRVQRDGRDVAVSAGRFALIVRDAVITGFSPRRGPAGTVVRITGKNFLPTDTIYLADTPQPIRARGSDWVEVVVTPGVSSPFLVVGPRKTVRAASEHGFVLPADAVAPPLTAIRDFSPQQGPAGTVVRITGSGFLPTDNVYLAGTPQPIRARGSDWIEIVIVPGASSPLLLVGSDNSVRARSSYGFIVLPPRPQVQFSFSPTRGAAGTEVTLAVTPAQPRASVYFNGRPLPKAVVDGGAGLRVSIPVGAMTGSFELVVDGHAVRSSQIFTVTR
ncbi:MAG: IPT/TIG domain-containing protein [Proteobacteria bacterium]|nr:IPT/TIG domain-containing protein [Pseudomonadota bacterium]